MNILTFNEQFTLEVKIRKSSRFDFEAMLIENKVKYTSDVCVFAGFLIYRFPQMTLRKAEVLRQLSKNIKIYE